MINQSPRRLSSGAAQPQTYLDGVYVSRTGSLNGPWTRIASSDKLGATATGSALSNNDGRGYSPGIQAWYNQFIAVDPTDANHLYVGLEEIYESKDGGKSWSTVGPYWNFSFSCWNVNVLYPPNGTSGGNGCPLTTHSDQHSIAFGVATARHRYSSATTAASIAGRSTARTNRNGNATDWVSLNDGTINALQYYYVGVGKLQADDATRPDLQKGDNVLVSGGLQDNGGSLLRPGADKMVSNFGGDGGDVLVDPNDGCNIVQEYVYLSLRMTQTCANPKSTQAWLDLSQATTVEIAPPDINAQFIAPFTANEKNVNQWLAGGNSIWYQDKGFGIKSGAEWQRVKTLTSPSQTFTAIAYSGDKALATWCGPCSNSTSALFQRGATVGTFDGKAWTWKDITRRTSRTSRRTRATFLFTPQRRPRAGQRRPRRRHRPGRSPPRPGCDDVDEARRLVAAGDGRDGPEPRARRPTLRRDARSRHLAHRRHRPLARTRQLTRRAARAALRVSSSVLCRRDDRRLHRAGRQAECADYRTSSARTSRRPSTTRSDHSASCSTICNPRPAGRRSSGDSATRVELPRRIGSRTQMRTRRD